MKRAAWLTLLLSSALALVGNDAACTPVRRPRSSDSLAPAETALRALQFGKASKLLADMGADSNAEYLLALMLLNGVGVAPDAVRARRLLAAAADQGNGAATFVLAGEFARDAEMSADAVRDMLQRSVHLGYPRAVEAAKSGKPLWGQDFAGAAEPALLFAWSIHCARRNDAAVLRRLGPNAAQVRDDFGRTALHYAAQAGATASATALIDLHADVNAADTQGVTPLMAAAESSVVSVVALLLEHGANPQALDVEHRSAVFYAARTDRAENLQALARAGAALDARNIRGFNALDASLAAGADKAAAQLRADGLRATVRAAPSGRQNGKIDPTHPGDLYRGWPPLALALARNDAIDARQLLDAGADIAARTPQGDSMLHVAANAQALSCVALLIGHGANPSAVNSTGHSVLWLAAVRADAPLVHSLVDAGVPPDTHAPHEDAPLLVAVRAAHSAAALALLDGGADLSAADTQGRTALLVAATGNQPAMVRALLAHRAAVDVQDKRGRTALWLTAAAGSAEGVDLLLAAGAKVSVADTNALGPLHAAAAQSNPDVVASLVTAHVRIDARDADGDSALMIAAANGRIEVVRVLLAHGSAIDMQNKLGDTALIAASRSGHAEICKLLLDAGADRALRNRAGVTAADIAASRGFSTLAGTISGKS